MNGRVSLWIIRGIISYIFIITSYAWANSIQGTAIALDGDTLLLTTNKQTEHIRLYGVDAPEMSNLYGIYARHYLDDILSTQPMLRCDVKDVDKYKRLVAMCYQQNQSINLMMIAQGWAISYRNYLSPQDMDEFIQAERQAF